ncbi:MAG: hypothetical protein D3906_15815 [Candidatus Electrothrix sp. AUS1_2]|nr:hypothetical protein [Candidatus Electrothrix sp. AUS1_2]
MNGLEGKIMNTRRNAERCLLILLDGFGDRAYPELLSVDQGLGRHSPAARKVRKGNSAVRSRQEIL